MGQLWGQLIQSRYDRYEHQIGSYARMGTAEDLAWFSGVAVPGSPWLCLSCYFISSISITVGVLFGVSGLLLLLLLYKVADQF